MIRVACPHCRRTYRTMTEGMGKTAVCTKCHQAFRIGQARPSFEWKSTDLGEDSWIGVVPPEEKKEIKHCIICDAPLDEDPVRCPACGANQVTGVVHRSQPRSAADRSSILSAIPVRAIVIAAGLVVVGLGIYWGVRAISRSVAETSEQLVHQTLAMQAALHLRQGGDDRSFARQFAGRVTDDNLPSFITMLSAGDPDIRRSATLLIGCGDVTRLAPVLSIADSPDTAAAATEVFQAIGARRLVELSGHQDPQVRQSAARALCLIFDLGTKDDVLAALAESVPAAEKIQRLNLLCRPWPQATGTFLVIIEETESDFLVHLEQIGHTFYLYVNTTEFSSSVAERLTFHIPIEHWCAATGAAVDATALRQSLSGSITLVSPVGASWEGTIQLIAKRKLPKSLPGFLPIPLPDRGQRVEASIRLERVEP